MKIIYNELNLDLELLARSDEVQTAYDLKLKEIKDSGKTPSEYMIQRLFSEWINYALVYNEYPYTLPSPKMKHMILWIRDDGEQQFSRDSYIFESLNIIAMWENTDQRKSVQDLRHYHIIIN